jgi:hypothetical protein
MVCVEEHGVCVWCVYVMRRYAMARMIINATQRTGSSCEAAARLPVPRSTQNLPAHTLSGGAATRTRAAAHPGNAEQLIGL